MRTATPSISSDDVELLPHEYRELLDNAFIALNIVYCAKQNY